MSLFIDPDVHMMSELARYESSIVTVANTEGIDLAGKLEVARAEIGRELERFFISLTNYDPVQLRWQATSQLLTMRNVVVTEALRQWHVYQTLAATYRDAFHSQLNTRYQDQYAVYAKLATAAEGICLDSGVGIVYSPIRSAGAPVVTTDGGALGGGGWFMCTSWTGVNGAEGAAGEVAQYPSPAGQGLSVTTANPPDHATGWNLYAGVTETSMALQNDTPNAIGSTWNLPAYGFKSGKLSGGGQKPDQLLMRRRILRRG
jgi:hypothetical protein